LKSPAGTFIELWDRPGQIRGVLKDFNNRSMKAKIEPTIFAVAEPEWGGILYVKAKAGMNREAIASAEKTYRAFNDMLPFGYKFLDDDFDAMYRKETQTGALFKFFAAVAVLLSCLGLFGLAVFTAERRRKEIGIRKVLGASVQHVTYLISKEFTWLVLIANIIAWPVAWYAMNKWMEEFVYRPPVSLWIFAMAGIVAFLLALLTISFQAIRAALASPAKSLRTE
jgi:putative ABC transport system permease protein